MKRFSIIYILLKSKFSQVYLRFPIEELSVILMLFYKVPADRSDIIGSLFER
ncbi:hypothetical protein HanXRQr2_Chr13g0592421 [Helianthus annuus]|uniref:Uncharacterized protein n=1 Tax=Helianthus annuus TaxID=4232 RepID=A0A9K3HCA2_HELAN|nr:hypothetical protein HanXRQr2_Chr13g0592421 [Helianthus annuus]